MPLLDKVLFISLLLITWTQYDPVFFPPFVYPWRTIKNKFIGTVPIFPLDIFENKTYVFETQQTPFYISNGPCLKVELRKDLIWDYDASVWTNLWNSNWQITFFNQPMLCNFLVQVRVYSFGYRDKFVANFNITVTNNPPNQVQPTLFIEQKRLNQTHTFDLLSNLSDPDNDPLFITFTQFSPQGCGSIKTTNNGVNYTFIPTPKYFGICNVSFDYTDTLETRKSSFAFEVERYQKNIERTLFWKNIGIIDTLMYSNDNNITISSISSPTNCTRITKQNETTLIITPLKSGECKFTYFISDNTEGALVNVSLNILNSPPKVISANLRYHWKLYREGVNINFLDYISDADNDTLKVQDVLISPSNIASFTQLSPYLYQLKSLEGSTHLPSTISLKYSVNDGIDTTNGEITFNIFNNFPVAVKDSFNVSSSLPISLDVLKNDYDLDVPIYENLTIVSLSKSKVGIALLDSLKQKILFQTNSTLISDEIITYTITDGMNQSTSEIKIFFNFEFKKINYSIPLFLNIYLALLTLFLNF